MIDYRLEELVLGVQPGTNPRLRRGQWSRESKKDNLLTVMARTMGSALGTVTSKVANLAGSNSGKDQQPAIKEQKTKSPSRAQEAPQPRKQSKRTKAKRKPTKKTTKVTQKSGRP